MFDALQISATGMRAHEKQIDTISHNVANINTVGFRRQLVSFDEVSADASMQLQGLDKLDASATKGAGSLARISLSGAAGELRKTGEVLDLAIDGAGFLEVTRSDGSLAYTRAGSLQLNDSGELIIGTGEALAARINVPSNATNLQITSDGRVLADIDTKTEELGKIELVSFSNPSALMPVGDNLYVATEQSGELRTATPGDAGMGTLRQGYLESSNVQMVDEMVALMLAQRGFEMNSRVAQAADQIQALTNGLIK